ncbi:hypothetical protein WCX18_08785 [Sulfurimonas sp. HSL1-2]|uniref:hypothetical protein n=1 Tax=Thiomicrolovo zhangzhouensis TaxID=3131933 RepID=UPI0031FA2692
MMLKIVWQLCVLTGVLLAKEDGASTFILQDRHGNQVPFVKAKDETLTLTDREAATRARVDGKSTVHAGEVFFKHGTAVPAYRYITTGRIIIRFEPGSAVDPEAFAEANALEYIRPAGGSGAGGVFVNLSDRNDLLESNFLREKDGVESAEPDWVLPVKLY